VLATGIVPVSVLSNAYAGLMAIEQSFPLLLAKPANADIDTATEQYGSIRLRVAWARQSAPLPAKKPASGGAFAAMCFLPQCTTKPMGVIPVDAPKEHASHDDHPQ
jgi:hypothetical protein